jgi:hypothetical protein
MVCLWAPAFGVRFNTKWFLKKIGCDFVINHRLKTESVINAITANRKDTSDTFGLAGQDTGLAHIGQLGDSILITQELRRGVTDCKTEGGYRSHGAVQADRKALFCAVTRLEVSDLVDNVDKIDLEAFVIQLAIKDMRGGMIKKRPLH